MDRRTLLKAGAALPSVIAVPSVSFASKPSEILELLISDLEKMREVSHDGKMWFFDDPCMMRYRRWGLYGWVETKKHDYNECKGISTDWRMDTFWQRPHDLLQELGNFLGTYEITHRVKKTCGPLKAGDINGIEITFS